MRAHWLQHVPFEGLGCIESWLDENGYDVTCTRFFESADLPAVQEVDLLIVMGGPMSVNDEDRFPWLAREKRFVRDVIESGRPVLGVCLGAQIIACSMGAAVYRNPEKEIGWFPIRGVAVPDEGVFRFPDRVTVFHWHGETFDLPVGARLLARSDGCERQAFQLGERVIGLQFHLETTPESVRAMVTHGGHELVPSKYVQTGAEILRGAAEYCEAVNGWMFRLLDFLATGA